MPDNFDHDRGYRIDPAHPGPDHDSPAGDHVSSEPACLDEDLELAYQQALEKNEAIEEDIGPGIDLTDWSETDTTDDGFESEFEPELPEESAPPRVTACQLVEAALFVGGRALTAKKLASLVGPDTESSSIEEEIEGLNRLYSSEGRPYEIRLAEGGYRLQLREDEELDRLKNRVFGLGPKEVKLSQEHA